MTYLVWNKNYNREEGKLGEHKAFSIMYDGMASKTQENKIKLTCFLNGIRSNLGYFPNTDEAKKMAKTVLCFWLETSGLEVKDV